MVTGTCAELTNAAFAEAGLFSPWPAFVSLAQLTAHPAVYGALFSYNTESGVQHAFVRHYWAEINQGKPVPRVCNEERVKLKLAVNPADYTPIDARTHSNLWAADMMRTG